MPYCYALIDWPSQCTVFKIVVSLCTAIKTSSYQPLKQKATQPKAKRAKFTTKSCFEPRLKTTDAQSTEAEHQQYNDQLIRQNQRLQDENAQLLSDLFTSE